MLSWIICWELIFVIIFYFVIFLGSRQRFRFTRKRNRRVQRVSPSWQTVTVRVCRKRFPFLMQYDVISFDIFDTLIFRPFSEPTDLFFFLGEKTGILDFKRLRMQAEAEARTQKYKEEKHYEIKLSDIWSRLENEIGVTKEQGMQMEQALEMEFCYANPFMQQVFTQLREHGKRLVITSDMYLSKAFISELLQKKRLWRI